MTAGQDSHCKLQVGGVVYELTLAEQLRDPYAERCVNAWSPRLSTGDFGYNDLSVFNVIAQEDFRHGMGHARFEDPKGYHRSVGSIDTRHKDVVQLATAIVASDQDLSAQVYQFLDYGGYVWAATGAGLRVYDPNDETWAACTDAKVAGKKCYGLLTNGAYLFVALDTNRIVRASTVAGNPEATVFTDAGANATAADFRCLALGGGRVWVAKDQDNHLHYTATIDASDLLGNSTDTKRITVGPGDPSGDVKAIPITGMQWYNSFLYVAREDGLWPVSPEDDVARQVLDWSNERRPTNGKQMRVWNDRLIIPVGPRLLAFTGTTISEITPPVIGQTFPYTAYGNFQALATFGPYLYVAAQEGAAPGRTQTLRPNGAGSNTQWGVVGSPVNWQAVDDTAPDYWGTYLRVETYASWQLDTYAVENTSGLSGKTIKSVSVHALVAAEYGPPSDWALFKVALLEAGQSVRYGTERTVTIGEGWTAVSHSWTTKPSGGGWDSSTIDALEIGIAGMRITVAGADCTQVWMEVEYEDDLPYRLLCFDGAAWHNLGSLDAGAKCLYLSAETDRLWINDYDAEAANHNTREMRVQTHSFLPFNRYPTTGEHALETSRVDGKLRIVEKCFARLTVLSNNLTAERYIEVFYRTCGEAWISLGNVTQSPEQNLSLSFITGRYIEFKFRLVTDNENESPILEGWALKFLARPDTIYGYPVAILIGDYVRGYDGRTEQQYSAEHFKNALRSARDSKIPVTFWTPWDEQRTVFVTAYNLAGLKFDDPDPGAKSAVIVLNFVEVQV